MAAVMSGLGISEWVAIGSAGLAAASFLFNWAVVRRQTAMQFESLKAQMDSEVLRWADEAIDALSEAAWIARGRGGFYSEDALRVRAVEAMRRLSAAADKGRLFFPNVSTSDDEAHKEEAFRGFRPPVLDCLVFGFKKLERLDLRNLAPDHDTADYLTRCRRLFVSEVQRAVDPRRRSRMMKALAHTRSDKGGDSFAEVAALAEALENAHPGVLDRRRDGSWADEMAKRVRAAR